MRGQQQANSTRPIDSEDHGDIDISAGTADTAYALKLIGKPGAGASALRNLSGASARSILVGVRAVAYTGAAIVGGVLTAVLRLAGYKRR